jgi:hypothetical protein
VSHVDPRVREPAKRIRAKSALDEDLVPRLGARREARGAELVAFRFELGLIGEPPLLAVDPLLGRHHLDDGAGYGVPCFTPSRRVDARSRSHARPERRERGLLLKHDGKGAARCRGQCLVDQQVAIGRLGG